MRLVGYRSGRRIIVARRINARDALPIAELEEFWENPFRWGEAAGARENEPGLDWEAELLAVVGRPLYRARAAETVDAIYGYAPFNDLTARTLQKLTTQWTLGKNTDRSGPIGDIVTSEELGSIDDGLTIESRVNGEVVQSDSTSNMIFGTGALLEFLSQEMTLNPGDLIATGTPSGVGYVRNPPRFLVPGDVVEVAIERVGSVSSPIVAE